MNRIEYIEICFKFIEQNKHRVCMTTNMFVKTFEFALPVCSI